MMNRTRPPSPLIAIIAIVVAVALALNYYLW